MAMANVIGEAFIRLRPDARGFGNEAANVVEGETAAATGRFNATAQRAGMAMAAGAAGLFAKGLVDFTAFDKQMREVFTLLPGISGDAMGEMTSQVKDFAGEFGVLPNEVVPALYQSLSAGVPADNVFEFLETSQKLAKGGVTDLTTAVDGLSSTVNAYGSDVISADQVSDMMFTTVKLGKTTVDDLSKALFNVSPIAAATGVSFADVSAALVALTAQGVPTSVATTQIRAAIAELSKEGAVANKNFAEAAGKTFPEFIAEGGNLADAFLIMEKAAKDNGKSLVDMFGSIEAGQAAMAIAKGDGETFKNALDEMQNSAGATEEAFDTMNEGMAATMDRLKARFAVVFLELGEAIAPVALTIGMAIAEIVGVIAKLPGPMAAAIVGGVGLAGAFMALSGPITRTISLMSSLGKGVAALSKLLMANPWVLFAAALVALVIVVVKNWDTIKEVVGAAMEWIWQKVQVVWQAIQVIWDTVLGAIQTAVTTYFNVYKTIIETVLNAVKTAVQTVWDAIRGIVEVVFQAIETLVTTYWNVYKTIIETVLTAVQTVVQTVWDTIRGIVEAVLSTIQTVVQTAWDTMRAVIETGMEAARAVIETAWGLILGIFEFAKGVIDGIIGGVVSTIDTIGNAVTRAWEIVNLAWDWIVGKFVWAKDQIIRLAGEIKNAALDALGPLGDIISGVGGVVGGGLDLLGFDTGGVVPGPKGAPRLVIAHGGETILPTHKPGYLSRMEPVGERAGNYGGQVQVNVSLPNATIRSDQDVVLLARELGREQERRLNARGVRTKGVYQ